MKGVNDHIFRCFGFTGMKGRGQLAEIDSSADSALAENSLEGV